MSDLDGKICAEFDMAWGRALDACMDDDFKLDDGALNEKAYLRYQKNARELHLVAIKQAFIDAGWRNLGPHNSYECHVDPRFMKMLTGQEAFERLEKAGLLGHDLEIAREVLCG